MDLASPSDLHDAPEQKRRKLLKERIDQVHYTLFIFLQYMVFTCMCVQYISTCMYAVYYLHYICCDMCTFMCVFIVCVFVVCVFVVYVFVVCVFVVCVFVVCVFVVCVFPMYVLYNYAHIFINNVYMCVNCVCYFSTTSSVWIGYLNYFQ